MGARTTVSTGLPLASTVPPSCSASLSCASDSCERASSTRCCAASISAGEIRFRLRSSCWRARSRSRFLSSISRSSTLRRSSTISSGVGLGEISSSGWPRLTKSPTAAKRCRTTPARMDLTLTSTRGSMVPTARALSTRDPRATATAFRPSFLWPPSLPAAAMAPSPSAATTMATANILRRFILGRLRWGRWHGGRDYVRSALPIGSGLVGRLLAGRLLVGQEAERLHRPGELVRRLGELIRGRRDLLGRGALLFARGCDLLGRREQVLGSLGHRVEPRADLLDEAPHFTSHVGDLAAPHVVGFRLRGHRPEPLSRRLGRLPRRARALGEVRQPIAAQTAAQGLGTVAAEAEANDVWSREIANMAGEMRRLVEEIGARLNSVAEGTENLLASAEEIAASSEEQSASTEEIASSANQLAEAADKLTGAVKSFRLLADEEPPREQAAD